MSEFADSATPTAKKYGFLIRVGEKKSDRHPAFEGEIPIEGKLYKLAGWVRISQKGNKYLSISARLATSQDQDEPQHVSPAAAPKQQQAASREEQQEDLIPF